MEAWGIVHGIIAPSEASVLMLANTILKLESRFAMHRCEDTCTRNTQDRDRDRGAYIS